MQPCSPIEPVGWRAVARLPLNALLLTGLACALPLHLSPCTAAEEAPTAEQPDEHAEGEAAVRIKWSTQKLDDAFYAEGATAGDLNGNGHADVVSGPYWYVGPEFKQRHEIYPPAPFDPHNYSDNFFSYTDDINGNGLVDVLVIGFPGAAAYWYENPGHEALAEGNGHWKRHLVLDIVDNESPTFVDLTGDGEKEIVCSREGYFGYARRSADDPTQPWTFHPISDQSAGGRFTHGLGVGDVDGDGRMDILEKSGWWRQPESLEGDPQWEKHPVEFSGPGGAQMFVTDVDGDGLPDVITSLEAHGYGVAWFQQVRRGERVEFVRHMIVGRQPEESPYGVVFSQPHALALGDIDGDGLPDLVTGKRWWAHGPKGDAEPNAPAVVYWFKLQRRPDAEEGPPAVFVPHLVHDDSGVGTDVQLHDLTGNGRLDIVVGNKRGTFVHRQESQPLAARDVDRWTPVASWDAAKIRPREELPSEGLLPEDAAAAMTVPPGFSVDLVAGEPRIHQPVAFTFDDRGRLWVAEAHTYPVRAPEGEGSDRIVILEDTNGDGDFDDRKVFIEGLNLVSGLEVGFGGVWVGAAPYLMFIPDADGDGVPDGPPVTLLDGWGYQDTHETLNTFNWGPDGWLYGCQGVFTQSRVGKPGTPDEERIPLNAGIWRYHPVHHQFEIFAHGTSNPWGIDFDDHGQAFITACVISHAFHVIQGGRYERQAGRHFEPYTFGDLKTIADHVHYAGNIRDHAWWGRDEAVEDDATSLAGGGHAHCGALVYLGDNWPRSYRGSLMMANIHGNRINLDHLRRNGSGFIASHGKDVIFANDPWFRGINLRCGPDGSVYIIDWYDRNACHRQSPEIWDRTNGRLFRVRYGDIESRQVDLGAASDDSLVELHEHENDWYVRTARRVLQHRFDGGQVDDTELSERLGQVRSDLWNRATDAGAPSDRRLRALWTYHTLGSLSEDEASELLDDGDENLRAWAIQLVTDRGEEQPTRLGDLLRERLVTLAAEERSPRVRLYLASLLQRLPVEHRWELAAPLVADADNSIDANIPLMVWYGVEPLVPADAPRAMGLALSTQIPQVRQFLFRRAAADPATIDSLVDRLAGDVAAEPGREMLNALRGAAEQWGRIESPERWSEVVARWSDDEDRGVRDALRFLSITFGDESVFPLLRATALNADEPATARREALAALAQGRDEQLRHVALELLDDAALRGDALPLLARFDSPDIAARVLAGYADWPVEHRRGAIDLLITRAPYAHRLLDALGEAVIPRDHLTAMHVSRIGQLGDEGLLDRLSEVWGAVRPSSAELRQEIDALRPHLTTAALQEADRSRGRHLYNQSCGQCHILFGEGGRLGPDLTGADRGSIEYWLENIVDPNAVVGKDYQTITALTDDGRVITGLLREETDAAVVIEDAEKRVTLPKSEIETLAATSQSLMPEGLLRSLSPEDVVDLIAYLRSPGQVPLPGQLPPIDPRSGRVPGAIEGEAIEVLEVTGGSVQNQAMAGFQADRWSGNSQAWWRDGKPGDSLTLGLPVHEAGEYEVMVVLTKAVDYGTVSIAINDTPTGSPIDTFNKSSVVTTGPLSLGRHRLTQGTHAVQLTLEEPNPEAIARNMVGIDYFYLVPVK